VGQQVLLHLGPAEAVYALATNYGLVVREEAQLNRSARRTIESLGQRVVKMAFRRNGCIDIMPRLHGFMRSASDKLVFPSRSLKRYASCMNFSYFLGLKPRAASHWEVLNCSLSDVRGVYVYKLARFFIYGN
jgi:hypothetical protein